MFRCRGTKPSSQRRFGAAGSLCVGLLLNANGGQILADDQVRLIGAELAPYAYDVQGQVVGLGVEIMQEIGRRLGHSGDVSLMPLKRAFQHTLTQSNVLMTPMARVASREGQLQWVIHYIDDRFFYVSRAGGPKLTHELARQGGTFGVLAGSAPLAQLRQGGVSNYLEQTRDTANINMLRVGRIDGWFTSAILFSAALKSNPELSPADFVIGDVQSSHCVYIVASNTMPQTLLGPWQQAFETMRIDGTVAEIVGRHLGPELQALLEDEQSSLVCGNP